MANYSAIKAAVNAYIKQNGKKEITGHILNSVLNAIIDSLGRYFQFAGGAMPTDDPGTPDQNVCYLAGEPGVYTNFGGITIENEEVALLFWNGEWTKQRILIGIREVNASVDDQVGTPSVDVNYSQGQLVLTFHNLKGNKGDTGDPAGFGTIGADINGGVGTPGVSVETSGDNTAKNLMFHFTNLKGETGVTSVVATIDNTSGTPSCQVSLVNGVLTLAFSGLKGLKGDTGVSADYPITIYNGLDSDATDQALAAAQGKVLDGKVSQLGQEVDGKADLTSLLVSGQYYSTNTIGAIPTQGSNASWRSCVIPVIKGEQYKIVGQGGDSPRLWAFAGSDNKVTSYCAISGRVITENITAPEDGYLYVNLYINHDGDGIWRTLGGLQSDIKVLDSKIDAANLELVRVSNSITYLENNNYTNVAGIASILKQRYIKYSNGSIQTTGSAIWLYKIPATEITKVKVFVTAADNVPAAIAFYSSDEVSSDNYIGGVQMVGDTSGGRWYEANVPNNAVLICVTNHQAYVSSPYLFVNNLSKQLLGTEEKSIPELGIGIVFGYQKADNYDGTFSTSYTLNSYFPRQNFQNRIRLTPLYGVRLNIKKAGIITIVKATGVLTDNCVMTTIKAFTTAKTGWQVLLFDAPIILSETESIGIGIRTDTATLVIDSVYGGANAVTTDYLHYTQNSWVVYQQNLLIDVLGIPKNDSEEGLAKANSLAKRDVFAGSNPFRFNGPFYAHLFLNKIYETSTDITVPSESLDDIRVSRRLGFNVIEANVQTTSDGKYVVIHGASGKFGYEVTDLDGNFTYADTAINSVTLDWIKANIRYRSNIPRFRTTIPTFEEFLRECRLQGMIPFAQANTSALVALLDEIMGYGNYFAYNGTRALTTAPIAEYLFLTTKEAILERARSIGVPYVYCMANFTTFTDEELKDIVSALHSEGFMIATAYTHSVYIDRLRKFGFDMIASQWNVNNFDNANLCTLCVGTDWSDFQITGSSATDSGVELEEGDSITPANALGTEFLAKGMLQVTFTGTIRMKCGMDEQDVTSDGTNSVIFSSYFINSAPTFMISGNSGGAVITDIVFKASKC